MLDGVSLDQLRAFVTTVEEGSFSAAGRKLRRAQSVVSELIGALEAQMGVQLFDRSSRYPVLTNAGSVLLADARTIVSGIHIMKSRAKGMSTGLEPQLAVVVDVHFPMDLVTAVANEFQRTFPHTPLRLFVEALGATHQRVIDGSAALGVAAALPHLASSLTNETMAGIPVMMVAASSHPLATATAPIPQAELARHIQLVLTDRSPISEGVEFGVMSASTWRLADLFAKHAFLRNGLGWGGMPLHVIEQDLAGGELRELILQDAPVGGFYVPMSIIYKAATPPGPAGRWFIERLKDLHPSR
jgi:DNA-binding transcriptional LysR family regulator